ENCGRPAPSPTRTMGDPSPRKLLRIWVESITSEGMDMKPSTEEQIIGIFREHEAGSRQPTFVASTGFQARPSTSGRASTADLRCLTPNRDQACSIRQRRG